MPENKPGSPTCKANSTLWILLTFKEEKELLIKHARILIDDELVMLKITGRYSEKKTLFFTESLRFISVSNALLLNYESFRCWMHTITQIILHDTKVFYQA